MSRFFAPTLGVFEDPVTARPTASSSPTGRASSNGASLTARQLSRRGGRLECALMGDRVRLTGEAHAYLEGTIQAAPPGS